VFIVVSVYFVIDSVRKLLDTPSYMSDDYKTLQNRSLCFLCTKCNKTGHGGERLDDNLLRFYGTN